MNRSTQTFAQLKYRAFLLTSENDVNALFRLRKTWCHSERSGIISLQCHQQFRRTAWLMHTCKFVKDTTHEARFIHIYGEDKSILCQKPNGNVAATV